MQLTLKENINTKSHMLKHNILVEASSLINGREGALQTEKELYLIMAFIDNFIIENLIEECNEDTRDLGILMVEEIEPFYIILMDKEENKRLYEEVKDLFLKHCKEIWDNQHSFYGVMDAMLTSIAMMDNEDRKGVLEATSKVAEQAFERRTEIMSQKADETNDKLGQLVNQYIRNQAPKIEEINQDEKENDTNK